MSSFTVRGQLAVITGAADGIGKGIAMKLGSEGCNLALVDIRDGKLQETLNNVRSRFPSIAVHAFSCNVADFSAMKRLSLDIMHAFKTTSIQLLFNNVGVGGKGSSIYGDVERLRQEMDVNLWSMVYGTRVFLPMLLANDPTLPCTIINTGSIASIESGFCWYSVSKHAVISYSETLRDELKKFHRNHNILVTTLVPAFVATDIRKNSAAQLGETQDNQGWGKSRTAMMIKKSEMDVTAAIDMLFEGLKQRKAVIPTHLEWHKAVIQDRMKALLNCEVDDKTNIRRAVKQTMSQSKL